MQPADKNVDVSRSSRRESVRERSAQSGLSVKRERESQIREASSSAHENAKRQSSPAEPRRSGSTRLDSPYRSHRDHHRQGHPDHRSSYSQYSNSSGQPNNRHDCDYEGPRRRDRERDSRDRHSSPRREYDSSPRRSAAQSDFRQTRHRSSQSTDTLHQRPAQSPVAAAGQIKQEPKSEPAQHQPVWLPSSQQFNQQKPGIAAQQQSHVTGPGPHEHATAQAASAVPTSRAQPTMSTTSPIAGIPVTLASKVKTLSPSTGLQGAAPGPHHIKQETANPSNQSQALPTTPSAFPTGSDSQAISTSLSSPVNLPGPPVRAPGLPSLPGPPPRQPPVLSQGRSGGALPSALQAQFNPKHPLLDFFSDSFDALKALYTRGLQPPVPKVKVLDNVVKCRLILPPELPESWSAWNAAHPKTEASEVTDCRPLCMQPLGRGVRTRYCTTRT